MNENNDIKYRYRRWPVFVPLYLIFSLFYFFSVFSWSELNYKNVAETSVMTIFILGPLSIILFDLKIIKTLEYKKIALDIFYSWMISAAAIFLLMMTYLEGEAWFGAIALIFFQFIYNMFAFPVSYLLFRIFKKKQTINVNA